MYKTRSIVASTALAWLVVAPGSAQAQQKMRPGLWEHHVSMKSQSGQMEAAMAEMHKSMASMPPEQRKQMEQMLAQQGVSLGPQGQAVKVCVTKEQAEADHLPQQEGCTQNVQRINASTMKVSFSCKGEPGEPPSSGEGTVTMQGPTAYSGQFRLTTHHQGKPERIDMTQSGKWLSERCPIP